MHLATYIPWLPALSAVLCGLCCVNKAWRVAAAPICIAGIFGALLLTFGVWNSMPADGFDLEAVRNTLNEGQSLDASHGVVHAFDWIHVGGLRADMSYFIDPLTIVMLFVVTGVGLLVAIYAAGYMAGDKGYARFFAAVSLFIFAMTTLVLADNLILLYLGWEGVGLCSYLLIGFYYDKPSAVAAAKKAFIVNRIGDLGFALGIFLTYTHYNTVSLAEVTAIASAGGGGGPQDTWIPFLLMLGAFGKSAQLPLYVWLPDAMEGPTPVSALIHAATMVTAGVYLLARLVTVFSPALSPYALPTVAVVGGLTAVFAATIALCQYDIKRIFAYSTISQLGYMFLGVGVLSTVGGVFHLYTHAFFKALLFLTAGSVMHAMAGQLDLRKMSGLRKRMPVTCWLMFIGCLALAGVPFTAGFYSKDMILAETMDRAYEFDGPAMTELTDRAKKTAKELGHGQPDEEHLLAAILMDPNSVTNAALAEMQVDRKALLNEVVSRLEQRKPRVDDAEENGRAGLIATPLNTLMGSAVALGMKHHHKTVSDDHVTLALLSAEDHELGELLRSHIDVQGETDNDAETASDDSATQPAEAVAFASVLDDVRPHYFHLSPNLYFWLGLLGLFTAFLTAFYTFRLWFRVFLGEEKWEMGDEHHGHDDAHGDEHDEDAHAGHNAHQETHHEPHEVSWLMNGPLVPLALGALLAGITCGGWIEKQITHSTAGVYRHHEHLHLLGMSLHTAMMLISSVIALSGIGLAAYFHWLNRPAADRVAKKFPGVVRLLENKWYVDELYHRVLVAPLRLVGELCFALDRLIIEPLVSLVGFAPRVTGLIGVRAQRGVLQGYGLSMLAGVAIIVVIVLAML